MKTSGINQAACVRRPLGLGNNLPVKQVTRAFEGNLFVFELTELLTVHLQCICSASGHLLVILDVPVDEHFTSFDGIQFAIDRIPLMD